MVKISNRLTTAAGLITAGNVLADVGTDHGYVPIYLVEQRKIPRAIAMDINRGPLERAKEHIAQYGMSEYIETRLSDGVEALAVGEAASILVAGMGGGLVMHILTEGEAVCRAAKELILQPQSELFRVRQFLEQEGYVTDAEAMVEEEGKYYPMMRVHYEPQQEAGRCEAEGARACDCVSGAVSGEGQISPHKAVVCGEGQISPHKAVACGDGQIPLHKAVAYSYGPLLLESRNAVLEEYLHKEKGIYTQIREQLSRQEATEPIQARLAEVNQILEWNREALAYYEGSRPDSGME